MGDLPRGAALLAFDGRALHLGGAPGRGFMVGARCVRGEPVAGAHAHVCALADPGAALAFDEPEVQHVRRDALACSCAAFVKRNGPPGRAGRSGRRDTAMWLCSGRREPYIGGLFREKGLGFTAHRDCAGWPASHA